MCISVRPKKLMMNRRQGRGREGRGVAELEKQG